MKFLFLVGVEGSGHHMVRAIMNRFLSQPTFIDQGEWHNVMVSLYDPDAWSVKPRSRFLRFARIGSVLEKKNKAHEHIRKVIKSYDLKGVTHLFESASFPYEQPRNTLRRPDILDFVEMLDGQVELKMLVLYRNPISATYSGFRREFTGNLLLQAKIIEDNLIFINAQLSQSPKSLYRTLFVDYFLDNPDVYIKPLSQWWGLDERELSIGMEAVRTPTKIDDIPEYERRILEDFFTIKRRQQWPLLYSSENEILQTCSK